MLRQKRQGKWIYCKRITVGKPSTGSGRLPSAYSLALKSRIAWLSCAYWVAPKRRNIHQPSTNRLKPLQHRPITWSNTLANNSPLEFLSLWMTESSMTNSPGRSGRVSFVKQEITRSDSRKRNLNQLND